jgi:hypothetical protein
MGARGGLSPDVGGIVCVMHRRGRDVTGTRGAIRPGVAVQRGARTGALEP